MAFQKDFYQKMLPIAVLFLTILNFINMKKLVFSIVIIAVIFGSCQSGDSSNTNNAEAPEQETGAMEHGEGNEHKDMSGVNTDLENASVNDIIAGYLKIKNALTKDNSNDAASAGKELVTTIASMDATTFTDEQKKTVDEVMDDTRENAEHIGDNGGKLDHQREHFAMLSKDVDDLIKAFGTGQKLYQDFCPMYDGGKGAIWISETKDIKNPYYGSKMLSCGKMKKEL